MPYSLQLAFAIAVATEVYRKLHYPSGYWIPMTALLVLKPALTDTVNRTIARTTLCTALGGAIALCVRLVVISYKRGHWLRAGLTIHHPPSSPQSSTK